MRDSSTVRRMWCVPSVTLLLVPFFVQALADRFFQPLYLPLGLSLCLSPYGPFLSLSVSFIARSLSLSGTGSAMTSTAWSVGAVFGPLLVSSLVDAVGLALAMGVQSLLLVLFSGIFFVLAGRQPLHKPLTHEFVEIPAHIVPLEEEEEEEESRVSGGTRAELPIPPLSSSASPQRHDSAPVQDSPPATAREETQMVPLLEAAA